MMMMWRGGLYHLPGRSYCSAGDQEDDEDGLDCPSGHYDQEHTQAGVLAIYPVPVSVESQGLLQISELTSDLILFCPNLAV